MPTRKRQGDRFDQSSVRFTAAFRESDQPNSDVGWEKWRMREGRGTRSERQYIINCSLDASLYGPTP